MMICDGEIVVTLHDLPTSVQGALSIDDDGTPCIHLNARLSLDGQRRAFAHEMRHLNNSDFNGLKRIDIIED